VAKGGVLPGKNRETNPVTNAHQDGRKARNWVGGKLREAMTHKGRGGGNLGTIKHVIAKDGLGNKMERKKTNVRTREERGRRVGGLKVGWR